MNENDFPLNRVGYSAYMPFFPAKLQQLPPGEKYFQYRKQPILCANLVPVATQSGRMIIHAAARGQECTLE
jgi:hypothetical protein